MGKDWQVLANVLDFKSHAQPHIEEINDAITIMGDSLSVEIFYDSKKFEEDYPNDGYTQAIQDLHQSYERIVEANEVLMDLLGGE